MDLLKKLLCKVFAIILLTILISIVTGYITKTENLSGYVSVFTGCVSIVLGLYAIVQSSLYNKRGNITNDKIQKTLDDLSKESSLILTLYTRTLESQGLNQAEIDKHVEELRKVLNVVSEKNIVGVKTTANFEVVKNDR